MPGIGNDVVALHAINVDRTIQYRFYSKIIVDSEKLIYDQCLASSLPFEQFVWLAWSIKEATYKCLQRYQHDLVFSPSNTIIKQVLLPESLYASTTEGIGFDDVSVCKSVVYSGHHQMFSRSIITKDYIFSVVNDTNDFSQACWKVKKIGTNEREEQSQAVREMLLHKLHELYPSDQFKIEKSLFGFPVLLMNGAEADFPVSFAHHDHFAGYAFNSDA